MLQLITKLEDIHRKFLSAVSLKVYMADSDSRLNVGDFQRTKEKCSLACDAVLQLLQQASTHIQENSIMPLAAAASLQKHWFRSLKFLNFPLTKGDLGALCSSYGKGRVNLSTAPTIAAQER